MNRYAQAVEELLPRIHLGAPGIGLIMVPPGEHSLIAEALSAHLPAAVSGPLQAQAVHSGPSQLIATGLPQDRQEAEEALTALRDRRGWVASTGRLLVLLLTRREMAELQRHAADVYSARLFLEQVAFIPDPTVDEEEARAELARWYRERWGRLDLRGFIRSESEDVSWHIEDIYQDIHAAVARFQGRWGPRMTTTEGRPLFAAFIGGESFSVWEEGFPLIAQLRMIRGSRTPSTAVLLGTPGSGKTFFLRWLAIQAAGADRQCDIDRPLPLLTSISAYTQAPGPINLLEYLTEQLLEAQQPAAHIVDRAIAEHRALFLLDGLDEVGGDFTRRGITADVEKLSHQTEGNLVIVTSRVAGYKPDALSAMEFEILPFSDDAISSFLTRWCELYARDQWGDTPAVRLRGQDEGRKLAHEVLGHAQIRELARSPLLLTVLAIVQRAGVRLPDHRVELYEHVTRILVERWNRVRGLSHTTDALPIKTADAIRLLGPVAVEIIRSGTRGAIREDELRERLQRSLESGALRSITSADEALQLFRTSLGLLVEQGPGLYSFPHLTLAEYFAARELVRTQALEQLAADPKRAFLPEWREILLLAAGELGINRADDARLESLIKSLLQSASRRRQRPSPSVPSLLGGLLADGAGLSLKLAAHLLDALIPSWWFAQEYGESSPLEDVIHEARSLARRIRNGPFAEEFHSRLKHHYGTGVPDAVRENLSRGDGRSSVAFLEFLEESGIDYGPFLLQIPPEHRDAVTRLFTLPHRTRQEGARGVLTVTVSRQLDSRVHAESLPLGFRIEVGVPNLHLFVPWTDTRRCDTGNPEYVDVEVPFSIPEEIDAAEQGLYIAFAWQPEERSNP